MTEREFESKLAELDRLLNDPETRMDPDRVWALLAEVSTPEAASIMPTPIRSPVAAA